MYAGGGIIASGAAPCLKAFAERTGIPVALTLLGLGGFPADHYLCLHMLGMHGTVYSNYAINDADLLLALGVRFDDRVTGKVEAFAPNAEIVHIDIDPSSISKNIKVNVPIVGDCRRVLRALVEAVREEQAQDIPAAEVFGPDRGELLVVGWGGTHGAITSAVEQARADGQSVSSLHLRHLNPFPSNLLEVLKRFDKVLVPELNRGQLSQLLRSEFLIDVQLLSKMQGQPFKVREIRDAIDAQLRGGK